MRPGLAAALTLGMAVATAAVAAPVTVPVTACRATTYLTFDTGSQSQADYIAQTLKRHHARATFFLANEKTVNGDFSLDPAWAPYWKARVAEGHAFGSHTFDHVYALHDDRAGAGHIVVRPQFGAAAGNKLTWSGSQYCAEIERVATRFQSLTGARLDPFWRAPGGRLTPRAEAAATACGYAHVGWSAAGFLGDELPSDKWPNAVLLQRALANIKDGDILMAHLGIWSRREPWAPAVLEPLLTGLEKKGFCFATLREHPAYRTSRAGLKPQPAPTGH